MDGESISDHFGRSRCFIVFDVDGANVGDGTVRSNTYTAHARGQCDGEHGHHDQPHSHSHVVEALKDCTAVLCHGMGWRAAQDLNNNGITPLVIDGQVTPREAVELLIAGNLKPASGFCRCHQ
jgi:predicted Fe-Mo cluster-binding NifX family protein